MNHPAMTYRVTIDCVDTILSYDSYSGARGYQYLTPDKSSSHAFGKYLVPGQRFRTNGHEYEVKAVVA
jgi:hypothetical protein